MHWAAVDVDGVLLDFEWQFRAIAQRAVGRPLEARSAVFDLASRYGLTQREIDAAWETMHRDGWRSLPAYDGAHTLVATLRAAGCRIAAVTGIPPQSGGDRCLNLAACGLHVDRVFCTGGPGYTKERVLASLKPVFYIDDLPVHCHEAQRVGVPHVVHFDRGYGGAVDPDVVSVNCYETVCRAIRKALGPRELMVRSSDC